MTMYSKCRHVASFLTILRQRQPCFISNFNFDIDDSFCDCCFTFEKCRIDYASVIYLFRPFWLVDHLHKSFLWGMCAAEQWPMPLQPDEENRIGVFRPYAPRLRWYEMDTITNDNAQSNVVETRTQTHRHATMGLTFSNHNCRKWSNCHMIPCKYLYIEVKANQLMTGKT